MAGKEMDQFDLSKLPLQSAAAPAATMPDSVRQQVHTVKVNEPRLSNAMATVEPEQDGRLNSTVFETENLKIKAIGRVAGLNLKGKF